MDIDLELMAEGGGKDKNVGPVARISVLQLSSTPVDQEHKSERDRDFSDEEDEFSSGEEEVADLSDSEPLRAKLPHARHNLKQRFVSLLRRFKVADTEGGRGASLANPSDIQALFQELESLSCDEDSGAEQDTMSISSTPKPSLRPFFSSSRSLLDTSIPTSKFLAFVYTLFNLIFINFKEILYSFMFTNLYYFSGKTVRRKKLFWK